MPELSRSVSFALFRPAVIAAAVATLAVPVASQVEWAAFQSRKSHGIAYDTARQTLVMYGGQASAAQALDETREFVQGRWQLRAPSITPGGLSGHSTIYQPGIGVVVFGGIQPNGTRTNETWVFDGNSWGNQGQPARPPARAAHAMAYDPVRNVSVMFGGESQNGNLDDTWEYGPTQPAIATTFGSTCSPLGTTLQWADLPWIGDTAVAELQTASTPGVAIGVFGFSNQTWSGVPLPISLSPLGLGTNCALYVDPAATAVFGTPRWGLPIPNQVAWIGAEFFLQAAVFEASAPAGIATTNALRAVVGSR